MPEDSRFSGFTKECLTFYRELTENNTTIWFSRHKNDFEEYVLHPARSFVAEMGEKLRSIAPGINADPRINRSLFRINRDTRFSRDKTPYKTHLALWFWEGVGKRMELSGFYFHLEPERLMLGVGIYYFPRPLLEKYRENVVHPKYGPALIKALDEVTIEKAYTLGGMHYKRIPHGYDENHPHAPLLLHNGLYAGMETSLPEELFTGGLIDYCFGHFKNMLPVHQWLVKLTE